MAGRTQRSANGRSRRPLSLILPAVSRIDNSFGSTKTSIYIYICILCTSMYACFYVTGARSHLRKDKEKNNTIYMRGGMMVSFIRTLSYMCTYIKYTIILYICTFVVCAYVRFVRSFTCVHRHSTRISHRRVNVSSVCVCVYTVQYIQYIQHIQPHNASRREHTFGLRVRSLRVSFGILHTTHVICSFVCRTLARLPYTVNIYCCLSVCVPMFITQQHVNVHSN